MTSTSAGFGGDGFGGWADAWGMAPLLAIQAGARPRSALRAQFAIKKNHRGAAASLLALFSLCYYSLSRREWHGVHRLRRECSEPPGGTLRLPLKRKLARRNGLNAPPQGMETNRRWL
jgi:hypothetical protein